jgi:hypothetical protein
MSSSHGIGDRDRRERKSNKSNLLPRPKLKAFLSKSTGYWNLDDASSQRITVGAVRGVAVLIGPRCGRRVGSGLIWEKQIAVPRTTATRWVVKDADVHTIGSGAQTCLSSNQQELVSDERPKLQYCKVEAILVPAHARPFGGLRLRKLSSRC